MLKVTYLDVQLGDGEPLSEQYYLYGEQMAKLATKLGAENGALNAF